MKEMLASVVLETQMSKIRNNPGLTISDINSVEGVSDEAIFQNCNPLKVVPNKTLLSVQGIFKLENNRGITLDEYNANIKASGDGWITKDTREMENKKRAIERKKRFIRSSKYLERKQGRKG